MNTEETKREKFIRLAEARTNKILSMLDTLSNCANTNVYEYTNNDVEKIFEAIEKKTLEVRHKFNANKPKINNKFKL